MSQTGVAHAPCAGRPGKTGQTLNDYPIGTMLRHRSTAIECLVMFSCGTTVTIAHPGGITELPVHHVHALFDAIERGSDPVLVTHRGRSLMWPTRASALGYYRMLAASSDGLERTRSLNVYVDLLDGLVAATDEY